ncbi:formyl transferase domain protein [Leptospira noguchii str. 1993005606]|uniref:Formyl transferase domain protein n=2 Tax=Leptospira noguchii TaxID=28182 RepID=M6YFB5_9LEPT|nr:formyltransferase family protein [Leptospira noguchii]EMN01213.1 formyl transferase domain protein [Leptospira noguchii str. 2007001578]EMO88339.1 formyl transferase domain protein [Leptospira noguchii str. 2001034031]EPE84886.1 formyl transferase domain protein [Leptospira noguchii str. 1993005606]
MHHKGDSIILLVGGEKSSILTALLAEEENVIAVLLPHSNSREEKYYKIQNICKLAGIPIYRPKKKELADLLKELTPQLLISAGYPYLLAPEHLALSKININIHPTLLPEYRGPATAWYVIADGKTESGVTVHYIDKGMDTGDIIYQQKVQLTNFDTVNSLMRKTSMIEAETLTISLKKMRNPGFEAIKQDETKASKYVGFRKPEDSLVDDSKSLKELYNFIRACDPDRFPAYMIKDGEKVGIKLFRLNKPTSEGDFL